jgi:ADP-dependent NAD(P)H-hydrate dehydratase / NAD(P)H-hydrate epimerase
LVTVATPDVVLPIVAAAHAEYMTEPLEVTPAGTIAHGNFERDQFTKLLEGKTCLAMGPGLGTHPETQRFIRDVVRTTSLPIILDADGLNAFAGHGDLLRERTSKYLVVTPHPGEMARLLSTTTKAVQADRVQVALDAARRWNAFVLLKGFHTILAASDGSRFVNTTGNAGLAKGGSGDVLTGVLAALTAQFGTEDWLRVLALGAYLHGAAADSLVDDGDSSGLLASDVALAVPHAREELIAELRRRG